jgi:S-formylglutathione hydrolase FrmB
VKTRIVALTITLVLGIVVAMPARAATATLTDADLTLVSTKQLSPRLSELSFKTPAVVGPTFIRVLVPAGYNPNAATRYPVLYLLHGGGGDHTDWTEKGNAEKATETYPFIIVMTNTSGYGNYADWYNAGKFGPPMWETYHINQLVPWIDTHFKTMPDRSRRAIAGLSMGGGGAMGLAAHHPDVFGAAAAFSGAVDTNTKPVQPLAETSGYEDMYPPGSVFGHRVDNEVRWRGSNPWDLATNLDNMFLQLDVGNGSPGGPGGDWGDPVEEECHRMMTNLHNRLTALGTPHIWHDYGSGGHNWFYWSRDLTELLPRLSTVWSQAAAPVTQFDFKTILRAYRVYDWRVAVERSALEFSRLSVHGDTFSVTGSGAATVTTPPRFAPNKAYLASISDGRGQRTQSVTADSDGRIALHVDLGAANPKQQYTAQGAAWVLRTTGRNVWPARTATVALRSA